MSRLSLGLVTILMLSLACSDATDDAATASDAQPSDDDLEVNDGIDQDEEADAEESDEAGPDDQAADGPDEATPAPAPPGTIPVRLEPVATGLHVPNDLSDLGDGRMLVGDQAGAVYLLSGDELAATPVLDLRDRILPPAGSGGRLELGLAGITAHPEFADNGRLYAFFTEPPPEDSQGIARVDVLAEFTAAGDPLTVDPASERELLRIEQIARDHVGGHMLFGEDGLLYLALGDAGVGAEAADPESLRGSVLRIDPDSGDPYGVPDDNPFVDGGGAPEVFAYGFRNPFRVAWLEGAGLLVADPKFTSKDQDVHLVAAGNDHGWPRLPRTLPGSSCFPDGPTEPAPECVEGPDGETWTPPVVEFDADVGRIASGVAVYGGPIAELAGHVLVSDWQGAMLAAEPGAPGESWPTQRIHATLPDGNIIAGQYLWSLDRDDDGEVYVFTARLGFPEDEGAVYRIVAA